jgi:hypothetical protein
MDPDIFLASSVVEALHRPINNAFPVISSWLD